MQLKHWMRAVLLVSFTATVAVGRDWSEGLDLSYSEGGYTMPYRLYLPKDYDDSQEYPLVLHLHGAGQKGNDNVSQVVGWQDGSWMDRTYEENPAILVVPQLPSWAPYWNFLEPIQGYDHTLAILDEVSASWSVDGSRIYGTGYSLGGWGITGYAYHNPGLFAAIVPVSAAFRSWNTPPSAGEPITELPTWLFHGDMDGTVSVDSSRDYYRDVTGQTPIVFNETAYGYTTAVSGPIRYTERTGRGHGFPVDIFNSDDPTLRNWTFAQSIPEPSTLIWDNQGGSGDSNWATAVNWDPDQMPDAGAEITIANGDTVLLNSTGQAANTVSVENSSTLHVTTGGHLAVAEDMAIKSSSKLEIDVSGSASGRADVSGMLQLESTASLVLDWVPAGPASEFGGDYVVAAYGSRVGQFDAVGGGSEPFNIGEAYIAGVDYVTDDQITVSLHDLLGGDADLDGDVDFGDYLALEAAFGGAGEWTSGDFDLSGSIDFADYLILEAAFGNTLLAESTVAIPEPRTLVMLLSSGVGLVGLGWRRRRGRRGRKVGSG